MIDVSEVPLQIVPAVEMVRPNERVEIYKGPAIFLHTNGQISAFVEIYLQWLPKHVVVFNSDSGELFMLKDRESLRIDLPEIGCDHGPLLVTNSLISSDKPPHEKGLINSPFVVRYNALKANDCFKVIFGVTNFRAVLGKGIKKLKKDGGWSFKNGRIELPGDDFTINIDYVSTNIEHSSLREDGGFFNTWAGELRRMDGQPIIHGEAMTVLNEVRCFLSFLNGRWVAPSLIKGYNKEDEIIWEDYSCFFTDPYEEVTSWLPQMIGDEIGELWRSFRRIISEDRDNPIITLIFWYLEANSYLSVGRIIFLQNAYELLFNWEIIEVRAMLSDEAGRKLRMSDKIRLILSTIDYKSELPSKFIKKFAVEIDKKKELNDFPYMFTEIRNSLVHSNTKKRSLIDNLPDLFIDAILETGIFYLELLILKKLNYSGKIASRISESVWRGANEIEVSFINK